MGAAPVLARRHRPAGVPDRRRCLEGQGQAVHRLPARPPASRRLARPGQRRPVVCKVAPERVYVSNGRDANLYGLEPNFGFCTANMHQGWPKLVANLWMRTSDGGLAAIAYAPSRVETRLHGKPVVISLATDYPFGDTLRFTVETPEQMSFPLRLRIPAWCRIGRIDGRPGQVRRDAQRATSSRSRGSGRGRRRSVGGYPCASSSGRALTTARRSGAGRSFTP